MQCFECPCHGVLIQESTSLSKTMVKIVESSCFYSPFTKLSIEQLSTLMQITSTTSDVYWWLIFSIREFLVLFQSRIQVLTINEEYFLFIKFEQRQWQIQQYHHVRQDSFLMSVQLVKINLLIF